MSNHNHILDHRNRPLFQRGRHSFDVGGVVVVVVKKSSFATSRNSQTHIQNGSWWGPAGSRGANNTPFVRCKCDPPHHHHHHDGAPPAWVPGSCVSNFRRRPSLFFLALGHHRDVGEVGSNTSDSTRDQSETPPPPPDRSSGTCPGSGRGRGLGVTSLPL